MKLKWKVAEAPTGRYRSFEKRGWPSAYYVDNGNNAAVAIYCEDEYRPENVKIGKHAVLEVRIADWSVEHAFKWRTLKQRFATLQEAKETVTKFLEANPKYWPESNNK
jgi:hypothetical protein